MNIRSISSLVRQCDFCEKCFRVVEGNSGSHCPICKRSTRPKGVNLRELDDWESGSAVEIDDVGVEVAPYRYEASAVGPGTVHWIYERAREPEAALDLIVRRLVGEMIDADSILRLLRQGGLIVSSGDLSVEAIAAARACGRMTVDADGFGYVYLPPESLSTGGKDPG